MNNNGNNVFSYVNRPMIDEDITYLEKSELAKQIFSLVDSYAKENYLLFNGNFLANNLNDGKNHITTASFYRLWEYISLIELASLNSLKEEERKNFKILDCGGCSTAIDFFLGEMGFSVYSVDLNGFLVLNGNYVAEQKGLSVINKKADFTSLPFDDEFFDLVFSISVLEHIDKKLRYLAIQEMERVVKRGGYIYNTFDYGSYSGKNELNYGISAEYCKHDVLSLNEISELITKLKNSKIVGNLIDSNIHDFPFNAPSHEEFLMYVNFKRQFNAFSGLFDVSQWFLKFLLLQVSPQIVKRMYKNTDFYNFFRLLLQKKQA